MVTNEIPGRMDAAALGADHVLSLSLSLSLAVSLLLPLSLSRVVLAQAERPPLHHAAEYGHQHNCRMEGRRCISLPIMVTRWRSCR